MKRGSVVTGEDPASYCTTNKDAACFSKPAALAEEGQQMDGDRQECTEIRKEIQSCRARAVVVSMSFLRRQLMKSKPEMRGARRRNTPGLMHRQIRSADCWSSGLHVGLASQNLILQMSSNKHLMTM